MRLAPSEEDPATAGFSIRAGMNTDPLIRPMRPLACATASQDQDTWSAIRSESRMNAASSCTLPDA